MVDHSFWKVLPHSSLWVEWVLRWKCTTPLGCKTNRLAVSRLWTNWVSRQGCTEESHHLFIIIKIGLETILERWLLGAIHLAINPGLVWLLSPEGHLGNYSGPYTWLSTHGMWWLSLESYPCAFLIKFFKWLKMFWFGKYRIQLSLCKLAQKIHQPNIM
jgi:hypothetical protein